MDGPNRVSSKQHFVSLHTYTCTHFVMMINVMLISSKSYNNEVQYNFSFLLLSMFNIIQCSPAF